MDLLQAPTKPCHNCRRRRLRCDRSYPSCHKCSTTGQECLGYGKLYKWADGAPGLGRRSGKTSKTAPTSPACPSDGARSRATTPPGPFIEQTAPSHQQDMQLIPVGGASIAQMARPPTPWALVDPVFQDVELPYRHYLSYFTNRVCKDLVSWDLPDRNPFRSLIPLTKANPLLQHIIVAASAAHMSNLTRSPPAPTAGLSQSGALTYSGSGEPSRRALMDALTAKQKALRLLHGAVQNIESVGSDVVLAAILFFINVELIESGKHGWKAHLEGAGRIMAYLPPADPSNEALMDYILSDCFIYYILASAFMANAPTESSYFQSAQVSSILNRAAANSYLCCPPEILEILLAAARLSNEKTDDDAASAARVTAAALDLMAAAQAFDVSVWASDIRNVPYLKDIPIESRTHAGSAHRLACCLYILQAVPSVGELLAPDTEESLERDIMHHLSSVPDDDPNFKATSWPTFIAGAETQDPERQAWVMDRLQRLVVCCPWGFIYTAMDTLPVIWGLGSEERAQKSWVQTLKDPEMNFLIV